MPAPHTRPTMYRLGFGRNGARQVTREQIRDAMVDFTLQDRRITRLPDQLTRPNLLVEPQGNPQPIPEREMGWSDYARK